MAFGAVIAKAKAVGVVYTDGNCGRHKTNSWQEVHTRALKTHMLQETKKKKKKKQTKICELSINIADTCADMDADLNGRLVTISKNRKKLQIMIFNKP